MRDRAEPVILSVETATRSGSISLARGTNLLGSLSGDPATSHSTNLIALIEKLLDMAELELADVDLFAAAVGPGSFTGLRIGLATVKSFAVCLERKCVGISTLAAIAHSAGEAARTVALLPAGRSELFAQLFRVGKDSAVEAMDSAGHLRPEAVLRKYALVRPLRWAGEGAHLHADTLRAWADRNSIRFFENGVDDSPMAAPGWTLAAAGKPLADSVAILALSEYYGEKEVAPTELRAIYVRPSDAEINEELWEQQ